MISYHREALFKTLQCSVGSVENNDSLVVLFHGLGSNGHDMIQLAEYWAPALQNTLFVAPHAPFPFSGGYPDAYQWFDLSTLEPAHVLEGLKAVETQVINYIKGLQTYHNISAERTVLCGFSQGAALALYIGLKTQVAAVVGLSGGLLGKPEEPCTPKPVLLVHGTADEVLPIDYMWATKHYLERMEVPVDIYECPHVGHSVSMEGLKFAEEFIKKHLYHDEVKESIV